MGQVTYETAIYPLKQIDQVLAEVNLASLRINLRWNYSLGYSRIYLSWISELRFSRRAYFNQ